ncbi:MAG: tetratricopeptide repeat protein [Thermodesulfobacteriota bacterium]
MKSGSSHPSTAAARTERPSVSEAVIKRQTVVWIAAVMFVAGFFAGVVLTVYKTSSSHPMHETSNMPVAPKTQDHIAALEAEANRNPQDAAGWIQLGNACFDADMPDKAIAAYETALKIDENNPNVWTDLGVMYRRKGQFDMAIAAFEKAASIDPKHEPSLFNKGIVLMHDKNDIPGAIAAWEKLLAINPLATAPGGKSVDELIQMLRKAKG